MRIHVLLFGFIITLSLSAYGCDALKGAIPSSTPGTTQGDLVKRNTIPVTFSVVSGSPKNSNDVTIYLLNSDGYSRCRCASCFAQPGSGSVPGEDCDARVLSDLKNTSGRLIAVPEKPIQLLPGEYHLLITEKINNIELPIWSQIAKVNLETQAYRIVIK